jgi:hypothetical protein
MGLLIQSNPVAALWQHTAVLHLLALCVMMAFHMSSPCAFLPPRYAIGQLYNPASRTICGLQPAHFVTLATPHCGCDADGVAQVGLGAGQGQSCACWQALASVLHVISLVVTRMCTGMDMSACRHWSMP